ncbi:MAG: sigma-54 dependent transcriptional regulator [Syntrophorhabdaceae bacterium]|nr:sigma-54 dependent transcriptional regulator [Syntrophorhabdaceae bacterium]MDD4195647.1 sigma-54 dependent transcriptional regulator [Syntrophorhabdaceae bacterium]
MTKTGPGHKAARVLIVDDEPSSLELLEVYLSEKGYDIVCAVNGKECLRLLDEADPQVIVLDVRLPDMNGIDILREIKGRKNAPHVIIITAFHDMETTIRAMKFGAFEYIPKPIDVDDLEAAIERAVDLTKTRTGGLRVGPEREFEKWDIIGKTKEMKEIFKTIGILSGNRVTVLIEGETGTGKELVARAIHYHSPYKNEPFIAINCGAIVDGLLESELFGHEKGAFTGAIAMKKGKFELASNGTILLDEIGEIPMELQTKLLRFLQQKEFQRVGSERSIHSNARVIAATNRDLAAMVKEGRFREDLFYRLNVASIKVPPLRDRSGDIPLIVEYILKKLNRDLGKGIEQIEKKALARMVDYSWPGNIRELENILTCAAMYTQGVVILDSVINPLIEEAKKTNISAAGKGNAPCREPVLVEKDRILGALEENHWHYGKVCKALGMSRPTLNKKMKQYGIPKKSS